MTTPAQLQGHSLHGTLGAWDASSQARGLGSSLLSESPTGAEDHSRVRSQSQSAHLHKTSSHSPHTLTCQGCPCWRSRTNGRANQNPCEAAGSRTITIFLEKEWEVLSLPHVSREEVKVSGGRDVTGGVSSFMGSCLPDATKASTAQRPCHPQEKPKGPVTPASA